MYRVFRTSIIRYSIMLQAQTSGIRYAQIILFYTSAYAPYHACVHRLSEKASRNSATYADQIVFTSLLAVMVMLCIRVLGQ